MSDNPIPSDLSLAQAMAAARDKLLTNEGLSGLQSTERYKQDMLDRELARLAAYSNNYGYFGDNAKVTAAQLSKLSATSASSMEQAKQLEERYRAEEERRMLREKLVTFKEHYKIARLSNPVLTHEAAIQYVKLIEEEAQTLTIDDVR